MRAATSRAGNAGRYLPERLPLAGNYYASIFGGGTRRFRPSYKGWTQVTCCFHGRDHHPSLSVNVQTGAFHCFSCGAKGGSLIDFVMLRDGCEFKQAVQQLGAWDHVSHDVAARAKYERQCWELKQQRARIDRAADKLACIEHALWLECRDLIHECDRVLCAPAPWPEAQWQRAQAASVMRDGYLAVYTLLSFGPMAERTQYVLHPEKRSQIAAAVRMAGGSHTDSGYWREVLA